jgi:hypothetical protein
MQETFAMGNFIPGSHPRTYASEEINRPFFFETDKQTLSK